MVGLLAKSIDSTVPVGDLLPDARGLNCRSARGSVSAVGGLEV